MTTKHLTDRQAVRLDLAIAYDAYHTGYVGEDGVYVPNGIHPSNREIVERWRHNIAAFTRVLDRYLGGRERPLAFLKEMPVQDLLTEKGHNNDEERR